MVPGCSGTHITPIEPNMPETESRSGERNIWGYWDVCIDPMDCSYTIAYKRDLAFHLNARMLLEDSPCTDCLSIVKVKPSPHQSLYVDVKIRHPFPGKDFYTPFDVRGVCIFPGSRLWPGNQLWTSEAEDGDAELLNPDGFTRLFNPAEYPSGASPSLITYSHGKYANADPWITVNAFKSYYTHEDRHYFEAGGEKTVTFDIKPPDTGPLYFGYVVDANWTPPTVFPVQVPDSFPPDANCIEAYQVSVTQVTKLYKDNKPSTIWLDIYDWQSTLTILSVTLEIPTLFTGVLEAHSIEHHDDWERFEVEIYEELNAYPGEHECLVKVLDSQLDKNFGQIEAFAKPKIILNDWFEDDTCVGNLFAISDGNIFCGLLGNDPDNQLMMKNMIESYTGMDGEFSNCDIVKFYNGHDGHFNDDTVHIQAYINSLGYNFVKSAEEPIDVTDCRMIVLYMPGFTQADYFSNDEVNDLLYYLHNGGRLLIVSDYTNFFHSKGTLNYLLENLGSTISDSEASLNNDTSGPPFPDCPIVEGITQLTTPYCTYFLLGEEDLCIAWEYSDKCILCMTNYYY